MHSGTGDSFLMHESVALPRAKPRAQPARTWDWYPKLHMNGLRVRVTEKF